MLFKEKLYFISLQSSVITIHQLVVVVVVCFGGGAYQHCSHEGLLYSNPPMEFRHSSPEALHTKRRERHLLAKDGTKAKNLASNP
jgi:hypothetical protein